MVNNSTISNVTKKVASRRSFLSGVVGASLVGVLPKEADAVTTAQKRTFKNAVDAFNKLAQYYSNRDANPLLNLLDPNIVILNVHGDINRANGIIEAMNYFYGLVVSANICPTLPPSTGPLVGPVFNPWGPPRGSYGPPDYSRPNKIKGSALWIDTDCSSQDVIPYTFTFNGNLISRMRARSE
jgi:hypothetical protein